MLHENEEKEGKWKEEIDEMLQVSQNEERSERELLLSRFMPLPQNICGPDPFFGRV